MTIDPPGWVHDAIFYQVFPDRFASSERVHKPGPLEAWDSPPTAHGFKGGDLRGIAEHLGYLEDLGVNALYLTPIFASASNHRYHTYDYFAVDPLLGGDDALRELLDAAHDRGIRVVLDGVFNHTGRGFWPFHHVLEAGASSPYRHWFHLDDERLDAGQPLVAYPPPGSPPSTLGYAAWWSLPALPKLNTDEPEVREYLFRVAEHWLRFGIDGWRLDVPGEIDDEAFWQEFRARCRAVRPDAYLVGEIWRVAPDWLRGDRFDALMNYPLGEAILGFAGGSHLDMAVIGLHREYSVSVHPLDGPGFGGRIMELAGAYDPAVLPVQLNLLGSHDTPRLRTMLGGRRRRRPARDAAPDDAARRAVRVLRRRGRPGRRHRSRMPRRVSVGRGTLGAGAAGVHPRAAPPARGRAGAARQPACGSSGRRGVRSPTCAEPARPASSSSSTRPMRRFASGFDSTMLPTGRVNGSCRSSCPASATPPRRGSSMGRPRSISGRGPEPSCGSR